MLQTGLSFEALKAEYQKMWDRWKPVFILFEAEGVPYIYDTGTNKLLECDPIEHKMLKIILTNEHDEAFYILMQSWEPDLLNSKLNSLLESIKAEGLLQMNPSLVKFSHPDFDDYANYINGNQEMLILEVTEQCNLRCKYCIFDDGNDIDMRGHGNKIMDTQTAFKSVDMFAERNVKRNEASIAFYGGEPLIRMDLIKEVVEYSKTKIKDKTLRFAVTTNGVLLDESVAKFLFENNFNIMVSLDGPEKIHDENRVDLQGKGSYSKVIKNVEKMVEVFGEEAKTRIMLSMVYAPPYFENKIDVIQNFVSTHPSLKELGLTLVYPQAGTTIKPKDVQQLQDLDGWSKNKIQATANDALEASDIAQNGMVKIILRIMRRQITDNPVHSIYPSGCCVPGARKVFVRTDGTIQLCEKMDFSAPDIGNINTGLDIDKAKEKFVDDLFKDGIADCSYCWLNRLCPMCYVDMYKSGSFSAEKRAITCNRMRMEFANTLAWYSASLQKNPDAFDRFVPTELK